MYFSKPVVLSSSPLSRQADTDPSCSLGTEFAGVSQMEKRQSVEGSQKSVHMPTTQSKYGQERVFRLFMPLWFISASKWIYVFICFHAWAWSCCYTTIRCTNEVCVFVQTLLVERSLAQSLRFNDGKKREIAITDSRDWNQVRWSASDSVSCFKS